ncbi:hypothetical protein CFAM422_000456 [Trichoderma lentiforme]|uniref:Uncharacterized protein n=1 Tax=Trichoderma lentiforme TaxID=1567552 RepID=A0A9P5CIE2_9HYPO|nr:hypothetical protein CFAM422_000456 [Trichoderma lentiforme]
MTGLAANVNLIPPPPFRTCHLSELSQAETKKTKPGGTKEIELKIKFKVRVHSDSHGRHILKFSRVSERRLGLFFPVALNLKFAAPTLTKCLSYLLRAMAGSHIVSWQGKRQLGAPAFVLVQFLVFCKSIRSTTRSVLSLFQIVAAVVDLQSTGVSQLSAGAIWEGDPEELLASVRHGIGVKLHQDRIQYVRRSAWVDVKAANDLLGP